MIIALAPRCDAMKNMVKMDVNSAHYELLCIPPLVDEQRAIAEALSDVDGLLNALEALIAKKQAIKQAVMQQLLTGKTRLPGFSGAWQTKCELAIYLHAYGRRFRFGSKVEIYLM